MKIRSWGVILGISGFFLAVFLIDRSGLLSRKGLVEISTPVSALAEQVALRACDSSQANNIGPLVPDQYLSSSERELSETTSFEGVPRSVWSLRAGFSIASPTDPEYWAQMLGSGWYLDWNVRTRFSIEWSGTLADDPCA